MVIIVNNMKCFSINLTIHKNKAGQRHAVITLTTVFESQWEILLTNGKNVNDLIVYTQNAPKIDEKKDIFG